MRSAKEVARTAKKLFEASLVDGKLDTSVVAIVVRKIAEKKPRGYLALLKAFWRLVRLETERYKALVESAVELEPSVKEGVVADLKKKYGDQVEAEFALNPELLGGMKIRVGSDVWDGSVKNRLERLAEKF
ncbi:F0F1 ATP synthase subunit delta [Verrucomicrobiales bacterium BCK34]|nr:F0F1 ATP synthase subunit delta [Verrucomicrobiales bacterium BCK34]